MDEQRVFNSDDEYLRSLKNKEPENLLDSVKNKTVLYVAGAVLALGCLGLGVAGIIRMAKEAEKRHNEFIQFFEQNLPSGKIAYSIENKLMWLDAKDVKDNKDIRSIQTDRDIEHLLWLDEDEIIYSCRGSAEFPSHHLYKANINTGEISDLFNPYTKEAAELFGDVAEKEIELKKKLEQARKERDEMMEEAKKEGKRAISVIVMNTVALTIEDIGVDEESNVYIQVGDHWYSMDPEGNNLERPTLLPTLETEQREGPEDNYTLVWDLLLYRVLETEHNDGFYLETWAKNAAWSDE
jgi:hypothetical protein